MRLSGGGDDEVRDAREGFYQAGMITAGLVTASGWNDSLNWVFTSRSSRLPNELAKEIATTRIDEKIRALPLSYGPAMWSRWESNPRPRP